jgi:hypothetical protein
MTSASEPSSRVNASGRTVPYVLRFASHLPASALSRGLARMGAPHSPVQQSSVGQRDAGGAARKETSHDQAMAAAANEARVHGHKAEPLRHFPRSAGNERRAMPVLPRCRTRVCSSQGSEVQRTRPR